MKKRRRKRRSHAVNTGKTPRKFPRLLLVIAIVVALFLFMDTRLRPVIENMASYQVKVHASKSINNALMGELENMDIVYDDIVKITQKDDGTVTSIQSDMLTINRLKSRIARSIVQDLESTGQRSIFVPLGTLLGNEWLSGRGPQVEIKILPVGFVQTEVYNRFSSAGINQTLHQVMLGVQINMVAIIPGYTISTDSTTNFCIADTVIVGGIPDSFTQIDGDTAPLISKLNDYRAGKQ